MVRKSPEGEIDIVARHGKNFYFVEVKNSRSFSRAADNLVKRQQQRIRAAALRFLSHVVGCLETECRFDAALVDGVGRIKVLPGAF